MNPKEHFRTAYINCDLERAIRLYGPVHHEAQDFIAAGIWHGDITHEDYEQARLAWGTEYRELILSELFEGNDLSNQTQLIHDLKLEGFLTNLDIELAPKRGKAYRAQKAHESIELYGPQYLFKKERHAIQKNLSTITSGCRIYPKQSETRPMLTLAQDTRYGLEHKLYTIDELTIAASTYYKAKALETIQRIQEPWTRINQAKRWLIAFAFATGIVDYD